MRLREYGENIVELTRSRERLETKTRIHGELGQVLLATRRYLLDTATDAPVDLWKKNIAMLRKEAKAEQEEQQLEMLSRLADAKALYGSLGRSIDKCRQPRRCKNTCDCIN